MATLKTIPIHDKRGIKNAINYVKDEEKTTVDNSDISNLLEYAENSKKTVFELDGDKDILVSGFNCDANSAPEEFYELKTSYEERLKSKGIDPVSRIYGKKAGKGKFEGEMVDKESREAYHIIMSFPHRDDLSPKLVHRIGLEFCEKAFPDTKAIVTTHMNTDNLHNHIVRSAYNITTATKYRDTIENLELLREINDELSLKYGLEILLDRNVSDRRGYSWYEAMVREKNESWKEILKADIKKSIELAGSWEEYKNIMTRSGYGITEKGKTVVYYFLNDENKRIRENKLGTDYSRDHIRELFNEPPIENVPQKSKKSYKKSALTAEDIYLGQSSVAACNNTCNNFSNKKLSLYVSRYTISGRRRSDLELIFLAAIKLINYFKDSNLDKNKAKVFPENPVYQPYYIKLKAMQESLNMTYGLGIRDAEHLKELKREAGAKMSAKEAELRSMEVNLKKSNELVDKVKDLLILKEMIDKRGLSGIDLKVLTYSDEDKRENYAKFNPMTASQRRELYIKLSESDYRVTYKYDHISFKEGQAILDFLSGKSDIKPDIIISENEYNIHQRKSYYKAIKAKRDLKAKEKYENTPVSSAQLKAIEKIKEKHKDFNITPTNMYEASQIIAYFNSKNPFGALLASKDAVDDIKALIEKQDISLNREHITVNEVKDIEAYINGNIKSMPSVLKPFTEIKKYQRDQLTELMELKNVKSSVPVSEMSLDDYYRFFDYLINLDEVPEIMTPPASYDTNEDKMRKNQEFEQLVANLLSDDQGLLYRYRVLLNDLSSMGFSYKSFDSIMESGLEIAELYNKIKAEASDLRWEYRNYSHLEWNLNLAKNDPYTKGVNFEKSSEELVTEDRNSLDEVTIQENTDETLSIEDDDIVSDSVEKSGRKTNLRQDMFTVSDYFD